ncbi:MAG TPA: dienelactone hydrolase family protein [Thermoanaerobaculia bacterium]|nr:dienelactone hydrolase family protein [Thermoanaerobaculia bacterium]
MTLRYLVSADDASERPMVVTMHGRGADMHDLADLAPLFDPEGRIRFVFPNAPKPFEPYPGQSFGWTWFEGWPPSQESVSESRAILLEFLDEITARYSTTSLVIAGFSQGAMMSLDVGLRTEKKLAGIIAMSGGLYEVELPDLARHRGLPVLIAHGSLDEVVPVNYARRARRVLEDAGLDVEYHEFPMGHQVAMEEAEAVKRFLQRVTAST